jgi:hypothetical protein
VNGAADVDGIPVIWIEPENQDGHARIAAVQPRPKSLRRQPPPLAAGSLA